MGKVNDVIVLAYQVLILTCICGLRKRDAMKYGSGDLQG